MMPNCIERERVRVAGTHMEDFPYVIPAQAGMHS